MSVPSGTVRSGDPAGYALGERGVAPAMVAVSKGGAKAAPARGHGAAGER